MNNFGGHIFKRVFKNDKFLNTHKIEFSGWAQMWGWDYQKITEPNQLQKTPGEKMVFEIQPSAEQTERFWHEWDQACTKI